MVEKIKKNRWDSQSGESNFPIPGTEGLLVTEGNGKPIGVTHPQLETNRVNFNPRKNGLLELRRA